MYATIVLDEWKLPIFERLLGLTGYVWRRAEKLAEGCVTIHVDFEADEVGDLMKLMRAANEEAKRNIGT